MWLVNIRNFHCLSAFLLINNWLDWLSSTPPIYGGLGREISRYNRFKLNLGGAEQQTVPIFRDGKISSQRCYCRDGKTLVVVGLFILWLELLPKVHDITQLYEQLIAYFTKKPIAATPQIAMYHALQALEVMLVEGWVTGKLDPRKGRLKLSTPREGDIIHSHRD